MNASALYAKSLGAVERPDANNKWHTCYFCGNQCGSSTLRAPMEASIRGKMSLINGQLQAEQPFVSKASSPYVCIGCKMSVRGSVTVETTLRPITGVPVRDFSWVISPHEVEETIDGQKVKSEQIKAIAYPVRAGNRWMPKDELRKVCLNPPKVPFAIVLSDVPADFMYKTPGNTDTKNGVVLTLNGELIQYDPTALKWRLDLAGHVDAAISTVSHKLTEETTAAYRHGVVRDAISKLYSHGQAILKAWYEVKEDPVSKLAVWLSPSDSECSTLYPPGPGMEVGKKKKEPAAT